MSGIDLTGLTILCAGKSHRVPFDPPLTSYAQARDRVVQLDKRCLAALGKSDITVSTFVPPTTTSTNTLSFAITLATFVGYSQRWWFAPGGIVERVLGAGFAAFSFRIQPMLLAGLVVIHGSEALYFALVKLPKHSVSPRTAAYWLWLASNFVEGFPAALRLNKLVAAKKMEREKAKH